MSSSPPEALTDAPLPAADVPGRQHRITLRSVAVGLVAEAICFAWVADSEIKQSVYLICYSLLMPAVVSLIVLLVANQAARRISPSLPLTRHELAVVYVMLTCALPIAGFGGLRFVLPTLGMAFYQTTADNWARYAHFLPAWMAPRSPSVWQGFFRGETTVPWDAWILPLAFWGALLLALAGMWVCLSQLLRRQWIEAERLTFPIVYLPLQMTADPRGFFTRPVMWAGFAIPAVLQSLLALNHLYPSVPCFELKAWNIGTVFTSSPFNAIGYLPIGLYPTAIGLAYFVPSDISFSCWFFYMVTKALRVGGAIAGYDMTGASQSAARFPYVDQQAAGAWLALGGASLLVMWRTRGQWAHGEDGRGDRRLLTGFAASFAVALTLLAISGVPLLAAAMVVGVYVLYVVCGARVRAEVGAQWTFSPLVWTASQTTISVFGSAGLGDRALTMTSVFESQNVDVRAQSLPNQLEAYKLGDSLAIDRRQLGRVIAVAIVVGLGLAAYTTLRAWYDVGGATAKANSYAIVKSQIVWQTLSRSYDARTPRDTEGIAAAAVGAGITLWLGYMRTRYVAWAFHPVGYVLSNTLTINAFWLPFFIGWASKTLVRRYGGIRIYRQTVHFFVGILLGDIVAQSAWTIAGRLLGFPVYQFLS